MSYFYAVSLVLIVRLPYLWCTSGVLMCMYVVLVMQLSCTSVVLLLHFMRLANEWRLHAPLKRGSLRRRLQAPRMRGTGKRPFKGAHWAPLASAPNEGRLQAPLKGLSGRRLQAALTAPRATRCIDDADADDD